MSEIFSEDRICTRCNRHFGWDFSQTKCPRCNGNFDIYQCYICGDLVPVSMMEQTRKEICNTCKIQSSIKYAKQIMRVEAHLRDIKKELFEAHDETLKYLVDNLQYKRMTEIAWYKAVKHFNGCFLCDNDADIRWLVIRPRFGGKYSSTNVLPVCSHCHEIVNIFDNPVASLDARLNNKAPQDGLIKLQKGLRYLGYDI